MYAQYIVILWFLTFLMQGAFMDNSIVSLLFRLFLVLFCITIPIMWLWGIHIGLSIYGSACGMIIHTISNRSIDPNEQSLLQYYMGAVTGAGVAFAVACVISTVLNNEFVNGVEKHCMETFWG